MSEDYFIAKWKEYNNNAPKSDKKKHMAVGLTAMGASGYGGWKMGSETGNEMVRRYVARDTVGLAEPKGFKANAKEIGRSIKAASKTKNFRVGAGVAAGAVGASYLNDKHHEKKGTIVRKSADHADSPFLNGEVSKAVNLALPAQRTKGVGYPLTRAQGNKLLLSSYKGGVSRKNSALPLQAKKATARIDRKRGTTDTPFGNPR